MDFHEMNPKIKFIKKMENQIFNEINNIYNNNNSNDNNNNNKNNNNKYIEVKVKNNVYVNELFSMKQL